MILTAQTESALPTREAGRRVSAEDCVIWILTAALSTVFNLGVVVGEGAVHVFVRLDVTYIFSL